MYACSKCGATALVVKDQPIFRSCFCPVEIDRLPETKIEKFLSFFGKKYKKIKPASIITNMSASAKGSGACKM